MQVLRIITGNLLIVQKKPSDIKLMKLTDVWLACVWTEKGNNNKKEKTSNGQHAVEASHCKATEHLGRLPCLKAPQKKYCWCSSRRVLKTERDRNLLMSFWCLAVSSAFMSHSWTQWRLCGVSLRAVKGRALRLMLNMRTLKLVPPRWP